MTSDLAGLQGVLHPGGGPADLAVDRPPGGQHPADHHQQPADQSHLLDPSDGPQQRWGQSLGPDHPREDPAGR